MPDAQILLTHRTVLAVVQEIKIGQGQAIYLIWTLRSSSVMKIGQVNGDKIESNATFLKTRAKRHDQINKNV